MTSPARPLIVDLGMHDGTDTEFYLAKGFDVLAVEANPALAQSVTARLKQYVDSGALTVLEVAVADHEGEIDFYLSDQDLWASTTPDMADRGIRGVTRQQITVACTTLDKILEGRATPYYVKIDVEGCDPDCIASIGRLSDRPKFVSFEADLTDSAETLGLLDELSGYGYRRFKLVNQAIHETRKLPYPALEGNYVKARFDKHSSGPFGEESPGKWLDRSEVAARYQDVLRRQAARIEYSASGKVLGIPMSRFHTPLMALYNAGPVTWARHRYAAARGVEVGGWFDIHAALGD
jgi:FkbM family methyltransferase